MLRGGPAQDKQQQDRQQKQKKRLSFREPEVEGPQRTPLYAAGRNKSLVKAIDHRKGSISVEDLTLEDQALQIAQSVGSAFSNLSLKAPSGKSEYLSAGISNSSGHIGSESEKPEDCSSSDYTVHHRSCQLRNFKISAEDQEYLDSLTPPLLDLRMRGPPTEATELNSPKNCIPSTEPMEERYPRSAQHQIQLLRYQLDQQSQQTQMALHQVQLLTDQMEAESTARKKAQEQNNLLMKQNKELLDHIERLFQQIEDLEKNVQSFERDKRITMLPQEEPQVTQLRPVASYTGNRRLSSDKPVVEKPVQNRNQISAPRKTSFTSTKSLLPQSKIATNQAPQNPGATNKKATGSVLSQRPYSMQNKPSDSSNKTKETLHIGDNSPPVQTASLNPFGSGWKLKSEATSQAAAEKATGSGMRTRTGSFSSFGKVKPTEGINTKSTLFSSSNSLTNSTSITNKKYSSSTSDLYSSTNTYQAKPLMIEEPSSSAKTSISSLSVNAPSKLPRFQAYTGWQRRSSLSNDSDQISTIGKETFKHAPETSLFNG